MNYFTEFDGCVYLTIGQFISILAFAKFVTAFVIRHFLSHVKVWQINVSSKKSNITFEGGLNLVIYCDQATLLKSCKLPVFPPVDVILQHCNYSIRT